MKSFIMPVALLAGIAIVGMAPLAQAASITGYSTTETTRAVHPTTMQFAQRPDRESHARPDRDSHAKALKAKNRPDRESHARPDRDSHAKALKGKKSKKAMKAR